MNYVFRAFRDLNAAINIRPIKVSANAIFDSTDAETGGDGVRQAEKGAPQIVPPVKEYKAPLRESVPVYTTLLTIYV